VVDNDGQKDKAAIEKTADVAKVPAGQAPTSPDLKENKLGLPTPPGWEFMPEKERAWHNEGTMGRAFAQQDTVSAIKTMVEPGETVEGLIMRGHYFDPSHVNAIVMVLDACKNFDDSELEQMVRNHIAGITEIGGYRMNQMVDAIIGRTKEESETTRLGSKLGKMFGLKKEPPIGDKDVKY
jgi:hypothetical protein